MQTLLQDSIDVMKISQQPVMMNYHQMLFQLVLSHPEKIMELSTFFKEPRSSITNGAEMCSTAQQEISLQVFAALAAAAIFEHAQEEDETKTLISIPQYFPGEEEQSSKQTASSYCTSIESDSDGDFPGSAEEKEQEISSPFVPLEPSSANCMVVKDEAKSLTSPQTAYNEEDLIINNLKIQCQEYEKETETLKKSYQEIESQLLELKFELALTQAKEDTHRVEKQQLIAERDLLILETENERSAFVQKVRALECEREKLLNAQLEKNPAAAAADGYDNLKGMDKSKTNPSPPVERKRRGFFGNRRRRNGKEKHNQLKEISVIPLHCIDDMD